MRKFIILFILFFATINITTAQTILVDTNAQIKNAYSVVDVEAEFSDSLGSLNNFLGSNIIFPEAYLEKGLSGTSLIEFVVCIDGSICNLRVAKSAGIEFDKEAIRVLKNMPNWKPAKKNGNAVPSYFSIPITFALDNQADEDNYVEHTLVNLLSYSEPIYYFAGNEKMLEFINSNMSKFENYVSTYVLL